MPSLSFERAARRKQVSITWGCERELQSETCYQRISKSPGIKDTFLRGSCVAFLNICKSVKPWELLLSEVGYTPYTPHGMSFSDRKVTTVK